MFSARMLSAVLLMSSGILWSGCGGGTSSAPYPPGTPPSSSLPSFGHVFLLVEENHSYSDVIGNSAMPYFNSLASQYGLATQYYANTHPSLGNYFMLTTGQIEINNDTFSGTITDDNIVRELVKAGKTWKSYAQSLPAIGYTEGDSYPYLKRHNPFAYFSDVLSDSAQTANLVPFTEFAQDLSNSALPDFSFIVPDALHDAHDGSLAAADSWLQDNMQPLISSPAFQADGLLIITFDESEGSDTAYGGGHVATVIVSPLAKMDYQSQALYQHQSTLQLILAGLGVNSFPGASAQAPSMSEFF